MSQHIGVLRQEANGGAVRFERRFAGAPAELWPFLTQADHLSQWITPGVTIDARVGGRIVFPWPKEPTMEGEITVFEPPYRLEYFWREGKVNSMVRLELKPDGADTILVVDHSGLPLDDANGFAAGWHSHLDWLDQVRLGRGAQYDHEARFNELAEQYGWKARTTA
jgi:uncharacterized protein YndB with AHSA1/START domain